MSIVSRKAMLVSLDWLTRKYAIILRFSSARDGTKLVKLSPSSKQRRNPCSGPPLVYQEVHVIVSLESHCRIANRDEGNSKTISNNSLSHLVDQNKDIRYY